MEDKLSKGGNCKRPELEYGNSGPENFVHPPFKISGSATGVCERSLTENSMKLLMRLNVCSGYMIMPFQDHCFCSNQTGSVRERCGSFCFVKNGDVRQSDFTNSYIK